MWLALATAASVPCDCVHIATDRYTCQQRALHRDSHRLTNAASHSVIQAIDEAKEPPSDTEGFRALHVVEGLRSFAKALEALGMSRGLAAALSRVGHDGLAGLDSGRGVAQAGDGGVASLGSEAPHGPLPQSRRDALEQLVSWLRERFPRDAPLPFRAGTKQPAVTYRGGEWTWASFDAMPAAARDACDWAIALRDLCVVDVDSRQLAELLEAEHPSLRAAPCLRTARGCHYYFARPPEADALGYFDGSGQRGAAVDFKSVTATG